MYEKLTNREWLEAEYVDKLRTLQSIADEVGCNKATVGRALKRLGIKRRKRTSKHALLNDKEWLLNAYVNDRRTIADIAREVGCTVGPVRDSLLALGIKTRSNKQVWQDVPRLGDKAGNWRGGRRNWRGYVYIYAPDHPNATKQGYVFEHRLVMEKHLGRLLEPHEIVHHINGVKDDNQVENLELTENGKHISDHFKNSHKATALSKRVKQLEARIAELEKLLDQYR